jgi:hypothetical protein
MWHLTRGWLPICGIACWEKDECDLVSVLRYKTWNRESRNKEFGWSLFIPGLCTFRIFLMLFMVVTLGHSWQFMLIRWLRIGLVTFERPTIISLTRDWVTWTMETPIKLWTTRIRWASLSSKTAYYHTLTCWEMYAWGGWILIFGVPWPHANASVCPFRSGLYLFSLSEPTVNLLASLIYEQTGKSPQEER